MNLLEMVLTNSKVYDLGHPLSSETPCSPNSPGFKMALQRRHGDVVRTRGVSSASELIITGGHVGTHIDALCHASVDGKMHGGVDADSLSERGGFSVYGAETIEPILARGVLFDVPRALGVNHLEAGYGITVDDLMRSTALRPSAGDVALIRTGWSCHWDDPAAFVGLDVGAPGVTLDAAEWLMQVGVRAAGSDTIAFEQVSRETGIADRPVHVRLLVEGGIHILEVLDLETLAADGVAEFLFVCSPLKLVGATGSPVRPLAISQQDAATSDSTTGFVSRGRADDEMHDI